MRFWLIVVIVLFIGCARDSYVDSGYFSSVESVTPSSGEIAPNETIVVTFVNTPLCVSASHGFIRESGQIVTIVGPFPQGPLTLTIAWVDGSHTLNYTVVDKTDEE